jgi:uncharacterized protein
MYNTKSPHTQIALEVIQRTAKKQDIAPLKKEIPPTELMEKLACFVSIHMTDGRLRGCIGAMQPREANLYLEIISNAISAATRDSRFSPIEASELDALEISVDVLSKPWLVEDVNQLDPKKYGVIVTDDVYSRGVLLPNIEGIDTVAKQLEIAQRKAGLSNIDLTKLKVYAFTSTRYL